MKKQLLALALLCSCPLPAQLPKKQEPYNIDAKNQIKQLKEQLKDQQEYIDNAPFSNPKMVHGFLAGIALGTILVVKSFDFGQWLGGQ